MLKVLQNFLIPYSPKSVHTENLFQEGCNFELLVLWGYFTAKLYFQQSLW